MQLLGELEEWSLSVLQNVKHRKFPDIDFFGYDTKKHRQKQKSTNRAKSSFVKNFKSMKGHNQKREKTIYRMEENICLSYI